MCERHDHEEPCLDPVTKSVIDPGGAVGFPPPPPPPKKHVLEYLWRTVMLWSSGHRVPSVPEYLNGIALAVCLTLNLYFVLFLLLFFLKVFTIRKHRFSWEVRPYGFCPLRRKAFLLKKIFCYFFPFDPNR